MYSSEQIIISVILTVLFVGMIIGFLVWMKTFFAKREYIISEIECAEAEEKVFWEKKLKKLYFKSIPIIGKFIK